VEGENSTSGPQPYQPLRSGGYQFPYCQHMLEMAIQYQASFVGMQGHMGAFDILIVAVVRRLSRKSRKFY